MKVWVAVTATKGFIVGVFDLEETARRHLERPSWKPCSYLLRDYTVKTKQDIGKGKRDANKKGGRE